MRLLQFVAYWWNNIDGFSKWLVGFFSSIIIGLLTIWIFGKIGVLILAGGVLTVIMIPPFLEGKDILLKMWDEFNRYHPPEDVRIIRKLKGEE